MEDDSPFRREGRASTPQVQDGEVSPQAAPQSWLGRNRRDLFWFAAFVAMFGGLTILDRIEHPNTKLVCYREPS